MSSRPGSSSGSGSGCNPEEDRPSTWSTAPAGRPGASFENPLVDSYVSANPTAEQFYVLDCSQGIIQTTAFGAREYRGMGLAVLDGYGNRVTDFDAELVAVLQRYAEDDQENTFFFQNDEVWELIDMSTVMAEASSDETIYYDFATKRFKRVKKTSPKSTPKKDGSLDKDGPSGGSSGAASGAGVATA